MSETSKSLYESLWEKGTDFVKALNKKRTRNRDIRAFKGAYDEAADMGDGARKQLNEVLESSLGEYAEHIDKIVTYYRTEVASKEAVRDIKALYKEVFGKELKVEEE